MIRPGNLATARKRSLSFHNLTATLCHFFFQKPSRLHFLETGGQNKQSKNVFEADKLGNLTTICSIKWEMFSLQECHHRKLEIRFMKKTKDDY